MVSFNMLSAWSNRKGLCLFVALLSLLSLSVGVEAGIFNTTGIDFDSFDGVFQIIVMTVPFAANADVIKGFDLYQRLVNERGGIPVLGGHWGVNLTEIYIGGPADTVASGDRAGESLATAQSHWIVEGKYGTPHAVFGPWSSLMSGKVADILDEGDIYTIYGFASSSTLYVDADDGTRKYHHAWGTIGSGDQLLHGNAGVFSRTGIQKVAVLSAPDAFSAAAANGFVDELAALRIETVYHESLMYPNGTALPYSSVLSLLKEVRATGVDGFAVSTLTTEICSSVARGMKELGYMPDLVSFGLCGSRSAFVEDIGEDSRYFLGASFWDTRLRGPRYREDPNSVTLNLFPQTSESGPTSPEQFITIFKERYGAEPVMDAALATFTGVVFHKIAQRTNSSDKEVWNAAVPTIYDSSFYGRISFDPYGRCTDNDVTTVQINSTLGMELLSPLLSSTADPVTPIPTWSERVDTSEVMGTSTEHAIVAAAAVLISLSAGLLAFLAKHNMHPAIRALTPAMCYIAILGSMLMYSSVILWGPKDTTSHCVGRAWLFSLGYTMLMACLLVKTWRLIKVFNTKKIRLVKITTGDLVKMVVGIVAIEVFFLLIWTTAAPFEAHTKVNDPLRPSKNTTSCGTSEEFLTASLSLKAIVLFIGLILAIKARNIPSIFNESQSIGLAIYNVAFTAIILTPIVTSSMIEEDSLYVIRSAGILLSVTMVLGILFLPRIILILFEDKQGLNEAQSYGASTVMKDTNTVMSTTPYKIHPESSSGVDGTRVSSSASGDGSELMKLKKENEMLKAEIKQLKAAQAV